VILAALETYSKIKLFLEFFSKKNDANKKQINGTAYFFIISNFCPCFFHVFAPVDVIENEDISIRNHLKKQRGNNQGWADTGGCRQKNTSLLPFRDASASERWFVEISGQDGRVANTLFIKAICCKLGNC